ncbi:hypothetical protein [Amaricoccus tamworthensis]|uniref:hypothetical protein n=1 Tax=Amaricoccus tamworthensis TaxID=57002 RepID=UPI003C7CC73C
MSRKLVFVIFLTALWAGVFVASWYMSASVEGPRNLDTGFRRLDVLARYQIVAFGIAALAGIFGIAWRREGRQIVVIGLLPVGMTVVLVAVVTGAVWMMSDEDGMETGRVPVKPTAPAAVAPEGG